jgi:hypothetical protein
MTALPADRRRKVRSLAKVAWFVELHDKILSELTAGRRAAPRKPPAEKVMERRL